MRPLQQITSTAPEAFSYQCVDGRYVCILNPRDMCVSARDVCILCILCILCIQIPGVYAALLDVKQAIGRGNAC